MVVQLLSPTGIRLMRVPDPPPPTFTLSVPAPVWLTGTFVANEPLKVEYRYLGDESYEQCAPAKVGEQ